MAKPKTKKKAKKPRLPLRSAALVTKGVKLSRARHIYQELLEEVCGAAPGMKRLIKQLEASIAEIKETERVLTDYGLQFYPELKWPKTVAYWRKDLCRTAC